MAHLPASSGTCDAGCTLADDPRMMHNSAFSATDSAVVNTGRCKFSPKFTIVSTSGPTPSPQRLQVLPVQWQNDA